VEGGGCAFSGSHGTPSESQVRDHMPRTCRRAAAPVLPLPQRAQQRFELCVLPAKRRPNLPTARVCRCPLKTIAVFRRMTCPVDQYEVNLTCAL